MSDSLGRSSDAPTFDSVEVMDGAIARSYGFHEFMQLALASRIRLILSGSPRFLRDGKHVSRQEALSLAQ